ncbi:hypothetical protein [Legionella yabuuchiae]|uniref:hypothetical protein n=1 Tax=Legionella yabuuchiae TaxID=376727 RepID=UPI0010541A1B|nr:hypothetical protein [Legionella yabuuchiae]
MDLDIPDCLMESFGFKFERNFKSIIEIMDPDEDIEVDTLLESEDNALLEKANAFLLLTDSQLFNELFEDISTHLSRPCLITRIYDQSNKQVGVQVSIDNYLLFQFNKKDVLVAKKTALIRSKYHEIFSHANSVGDYVFYKAKSNLDRCKAIKTFNDAWQDLVYMEAVVSNQYENTCDLSLNVKSIMNLDQSRILFGFDILYNDKVIHSTCMHKAPFFTDNVTEKDLEDKKSLLTCRSSFGIAAAIATVGFFSYKLYQEDVINQYFCNNTLPS